MKKTLAISSFIFVLIIYSCKTMPCDCKNQNTNIPSTNELAIREVFLNDRGYNLFDQDSLDQKILKYLTLTGENREEEWNEDDSEEEKEARMSAKLAYIFRNQCQNKFEDCYVDLISLRPRPKSCNCLMPKNGKIDILLTHPGTSITVKLKETNEVVSAEKVLTDNIHEAYRITFPKKGLYDFDITLPSPDNSENLTYKSNLNVDW
ncbi:hypothetical protein [Maribacter sp. 2210JD10-5]|uniref:hypothetical protein n=1 Tax=Maribacter sp. 2210JD10-5 TaxID=3386272 RepID=UPI0039BCFAB7